MKAHRLATTVVGLGKAKLASRLREMADAVSKVRFSGDDAAAVLTAYGRARCRSGGVFARCCETLRGEVAAVQPALLVEAWKEVQACGWEDSLLDALIASELTDPQSRMHYSRLDKAPALEMYLLLLSRTPHAAAVSRVAVQLSTHIPSLSAREMGRIASSLTRTLSEPERLIAAPEVLRSAICERAVVEVVVLTMGVREAAAILQLCAGAGFVEKEKVLRMLEPYHRQFTRPFLEASLVVTPPECLGHICLVYAEVAETCLAEEVLRWCAEALQKHYVECRRVVPSNVREDMAHAVEVLRRRSAL